MTEGDALPHGVSRVRSPVARTDRPRVLLLLHEASQTGAPILARDTFQALTSNVVLRSILWDGGPLETDFRRLGHLTVLSSYPRFLPRLRGAASAAVAMKVVRHARLPLEGWRARRWRPHVVYANSIWSLPLVARLGLAGRPVLLHVHELTVALAEFEATHPGLLGRTSSRYIAVSDAVAAALRDVYHVPPSSISVIRPCVAMPVDLRALARPPGAPLVVGGMGNPSWTKGGVLWLLAAREVVDRLGEGSVRFRWVGIRENAEGRQFRAMADKLGLAGSVDFIPETRTPLAELATFDVLAVTSWEESASLVVLEAMGLTLPVVAFRGAGGPEEVLTDGGILVDGFSPTAMGLVVVALLRDPVRRRSIGLAGRAQAESFSAPGRTAPLVLHEILGLMSGRA
jgi:glycosyltransferase involved in cell wall biosynthesis